MAVVPFAQPDPNPDADVRVPTPQREGSAVVIQLKGDGDGYDPETNTVQVEGEDGEVVVSFGPPQPEPKESKFGDNLATKLTEGELTAISEKLMAGIEADEMSRQAWLENAARGIGLLGLELKAQQGASAGAAQTPAEGTSNVDHPLLLEAVLRFQANARGELLPADGPVKVRNDGEGNSLNLELSSALEKDMNHYLTKTAKEYYPDTDRMLLLLGFSGISFKKGYHDPIKRRPVIASIDSKDLIVSNATTDLDSAGRITHRIMARPSFIKRMQIVGAYRDVELPIAPLMPLKNVVDEKIGQVQGIQPVGITYETADLDRELYECYCEIEIPGFEHKFEGNLTGLPLPYKVVLDKDSRKILEIRRIWDEDDPLCMPQNRIIAYIFIPGLGFYGIGLLNVLGNATKAVTAAWRLMLDAGMFSNFPGFLYLKSFAKQLTNQFRVPPGSGMPIDTVGNDIRASVMPLPYKDPSAVFIQLIDNIATTAQRVGGTAELQVGEGKQDAPVGTTLALLEQATKLMSAVHKRLHQAQSEEFALLKSLLMEDPEALWRHNKKSQVLRFLNAQIPELAQVTEQQEQADTRRKQIFLAALADCDLVPAADPNTSSQTERYLKVYALRQIAVTNQNIDLNAVDQRAIKVLGFDDAQAMFKQPDPNAPPPMPPPEQLMAQASQMAAQARMMDSQTRMMEARIKLASSQTEAQQRQQELQAKDQIARLGVAREMVIHSHDQKNETGRLAMQQSAETNRLSMQHDNEAANRQHQLRMKVLDHLVDVHKAQQGHAVGIHKTALGHHSKMQTQGLAHVHEAQQSALDREHQFQMQQQEPEPVNRAFGGRVVYREPPVMEVVTELAKAVRAVEASNAALAAEFKRSADVASLPRTLIRDQGGRITGVRIDQPAPPPLPTPDVNPEDESVEIELEDGSS